MPALQPHPVDGLRTGVIAAVLVAIAVTVAAMVVRANSVMDESGVDTALLTLPSPSSTVDPGGEAIVSSLPVEQPVPLRVFTIGPDWVAVLDFEAASTTVYPEEASRSHRAATGR